MRAIKEQECFDTVKNAIFTVNGQPIKYWLSGKTYQEISDEELIRDYMSYTNYDFLRDNSFGLLDDDRKELVSIFCAAYANENPSEFPDFKFSNGYIEHFQITSSKTTRKGSEHKKKTSQFEKKVEIESEAIKRKYSDTPDYEEIPSSQWLMDNPVHSHEFLIKSFKANWKNHYESMEEYSGNKEIGIFMIEYEETALTMTENVYADWPDGMSWGDMRDEEKFHNYRLSRDKQMLKFIYQYKEKIKYVIFVYKKETGEKRIEIIQLESILYLIKLLPWDYSIDAMMVRTIASICNFKNNSPQIIDENKDREKTE